MDEFLMQFFAYEHLPEKLQFHSAPYARLATALMENVPSNPMRTIALQKLIEAKDAAVRAALAKTT